ncbi:MAG: DNA polymerase III subunit delta [Bacteroidales bacterium]|nr:DNA polymerase III subunit delta [Bacteroidales bacterium]
MAKSDDFNTIRANIEAGTFAPVYLLHGDEGYFIDRITDMLLDRVLTAEERDFNLFQYYAADVENLGEVVSACRRYPMFGERQLVLLREAQMLKQNVTLTKYEQLEAYLAHPLESTVFVITMKGKKADSRARWVKQIQAAGGVVFESKRVPDYELPKFLPGFLRETGMTFEPDAIQMLADYIGSDLARLMSEMDKLRLSIGNHPVTTAAIAQHIGISKEFNPFELVNAVAVKDFKRCEIIRRYFAQNPKDNPIQITLSVLFTFFSNLMLAHYAQDKSLNGLMREVGMSYPQAKVMVEALRRYNAWKAMSAISLIREYDAQQKGARNAVMPDDEALKELLYKLMH